MHILQQRAYRFVCVCVCVCVCIHYIILFIISAAESTYDRKCVCVYTPMCVFIIFIISIAESTYDHDPRVIIVGDFRQELLECRV